MTTPTRRFDLIERDLGTRLILCDAGSETYHVLNETARRIWLMLDGRHTLPVMREIYVSFYPHVNRELLEQDLLWTLEELRARGLLEEAARSAA